MGINITEWMNNEIPLIAEELKKEITEGVHIETEEGLNIAGREAICDVLGELLSALFPGVWSRKRIHRADISFYIDDALRHVTYKLSNIINDILHYHCAKENCSSCNCKNEALDMSTSLIKKLPEIRRMLLKDIESAFDGDPASVSLDEILLSYPFVEAIATHRISHELYKYNVPIIPRIMSERAHSNTGIDIHPGATIGEGFFIDHGTGVVIGETCNIGKNVKIYQGVTLGATSPFDKSGTPKRGKKRHPDIEDDVIIYANAVILGGNTTIGKGSVIGGNAWVTKSVPENSVVYTSFSTEMRSK